MVVCFLIHVDLFLSLRVILSVALFIDLSVIRSLFLVIYIYSMLHNHTL